MKISVSRQLSKYSILLILSGFLFLPVCNLIAQDSTNSEQSIIIKDSTENQKEKTFTKSPFGAIWRSFAIPGWGQIYVENYWKAPIFFVGAGACIYLIAWNNNRYSSYQKQYDALKSTTPNDKIALDLLSRQKEFYRDNRDKSYFFLGITYILAAVDAYVGAYLFDFEVNDNVNLHIAPYYNTYAGISLSFKIK